MSTDLGSTLKSLAVIIASDGFTQIAPVITAALADIHANPQSWVNPLTAPLKVVKLEADLAGALPAAENVSIADAADFVAGFWTKILADLATKAAAAKAALNPAPAAAPAA